MSVYTHLLAALEFTHVSIPTSRQTTVLIVLVLIAVWSMCGPNQEN
jgi:hypothetical protein